MNIALWERNSNAIFTEQPVDGETNITFNARINKAITYKKANIKYQCRITKIMKLHKMNLLAN